MKLFNYVLTALRYFSTKTKTTQSAKLALNSFKNKRNCRRKKSESTTVIKWTDQQLQVLAAISNGKSVFISGSAGTGKTILVKHIIERLKGIHGASRVFTTASTGVAACAIEGQTLHSFAGIGLGEADRKTLVLRVLGDKKALTRWIKVEALVIDEVSMLDDAFFDNLEYIAREIREVDKTWGGIQLIVSGDFFQLPPVSGNRKPKGYAFEAKCWASSFDLQVELTKIFRQSDPQLIKLLQGIRRGECDPEDLRILQERCSEAEPDPSVVRFYPRKEDVDSVNRKQMHNLCEEIVVYGAVDSGKDPWKGQLKYGLAPDKLELCVGARVMLNKNIEPWRKLVNGATGTVIGFCEADYIDNNDDIYVGDMCENDLVPKVKFDSGAVVDIYPQAWDVFDGDKVVATRKQIPLILAWALSIHKCQGMTLDRVHTDLSRAFGFGMVYVAVSRVKSLDALHLSDFNPSKIMAHPKVLQFYKWLAGEQDNKQGEDDVANKNCRRWN